MPDTPMAANTREERFFAEVGRSATIWVLQNGDGWLNWSEEGVLCIPLWSQSDDAKGCAAAPADYQPAGVGVADFVQHYLPQLASRGAWFAINPTPDLAGNQLPADRLAAALRDAGA